VAGGRTHRFAADPVGPLRGRSGRCSTARFVASAWRGETAHRFADELEKVEPSDHCDLLLSLERVWRCDVYRAGDGIHQAWMQRRDAASSFVRRWLRRFNAKHHDALELEQALFSGGARRVIANSQMVKREAGQFYGYPAERIDVVPNGVPLADFRPDPEARALRRKILRLREDEIAVLFVGSGWERKGLRHAIEAVNSLGKNYRLFVAGRGRGRARVARLTRFLAGDRLRSLVGTPSGRTPGR